MGIFAKLRGKKRGAGEKQKSSPAAPASEIKHKEREAMSKRVPGAFVVSLGVRMLHENGPGRWRKRRKKSKRVDQLSTLFTLFLIFQKKAQFTSWSLAS